MGSILVMLFITIGIPYMISQIQFRWPLLGKIISFITASAGIAMLTFIIAAIFSDSHNGGLVNITIIIGFVIWLITVRNIFRTKPEKIPYSPVRSGWPIGMILQGGNPLMNKSIGSVLSTIPASRGTLFQIKELTLNEKVEYMDIGDKNGVILTFMDKTILKIELLNLAKIVAELIRDFKKNQFAPGELANHFLYLRDTYRSTLPPGEYSQLMDILGRFVREGGTVELV